MDHVTIFVIVMIVIVGLSITGYFVYQNNSGDGKPKSKSDVIIITDEGSTFETQTSGTETYISMPRMDECRGRQPGDGFAGEPSFCGAITPTTEMNYVFDTVGGSIDSDGQFKTTFNFETNMCADGTQNCLYEEKFDETRKLIGITNAQGDDFIQKFIDDIYSGKVDFDITRDLGGGRGSQNLKKLIKNMITFDTTTGKLSFNNPGMTPPTVELIPGNNVNRGQGVVDGKMKVPVGQMIMYIIFYYYGNDLPKPIIKLNLTSQETLGKVYQDMLDILAARDAGPQPDANTDGGGTGHFSDGGGLSNAPRPTPSVEVREKIDAWIKQYNLNPYGEHKDLMYTGGTPLFDETIGTSIDRYVYIISNNGHKPWDSLPMAYLR